MSAMEAAYDPLDTFAVLPAPGGRLLLTCRCGWELSCSNRSLRYLVREAAEHANFNHAPAPGPRYTGPLCLDPDCPDCADRRRSS